MIYNDLLTTNLIINNINKINTGIIIIDIIFMFFISVIIYFINNNSFKIKLNNYCLSIINYFDKTNKIIFCSEDDKQSKKFRAIMYYLSNLNNKNIKSLIEIVDWKFSYNDSFNIEQNSFYRVEQKNSFLINQFIYGKIYIKDKSNNKGDIKEYLYLEIFSKKKNLIELQSWVDNKVNEYNNYLLNKNKNQLLIDIFWNNTKKDIDIYNYNWQSNVTFNNRFFTNKDNILKNIDFFLNNENWYKNRGIPYTLGFLLWGNPGCGKTGFIKALMNYTKYNSIIIKLNNNFNFIKLKEIIYNEEITNDLIIPLNKRIIVLEDIDCMIDIIIDRNIDKNIDDNTKKNKINSNNNNNLSYLLNILDGLHECNGRIIIMTSNKPEILDKALIRPGRIDHIINFTNATINDMINILEFYWDENINYNLLDEKLNLKYTHAEIINICRNSNDIYDTINKL